MSNNRISDQGIGKDVKGSTSA